MADQNQSKPGVLESLPSHRPQRASSRRSQGKTHTATRTRSKQAGGAGAIKTTSVRKRKKVRPTTARANPAAGPRKSVERGLTETVSETATGLVKLGLHLSSEIVSGAVRLLRR